MMKLCINSTIPATIKAFFGEQLKFLVHSKTSLVSAQGMKKPCEEDYIVMKKGLKEISKASSK